MIARLSQLSLAVVAVCTCAATSQADFMVTGEETAPGTYTFVLQGMPGDPIQNRTVGQFEILDFRIDVPGGVVIGTPSGTIFDGTNTMMPTLFGWTAGPVADAEELAALPAATISSANAASSTVSRMPESRRFCPTTSRSASAPSTGRGARCPVSAGRQTGPSIRIARIKGRTAAVR